MAKRDEVYRFDFKTPKKNLKRIPFEQEYLPRCKINFRSRIETKLDLSYPINLNANEIHLQF
jgi:hypothetical protein